MKTNHRPKIGRAVGRALGGAVDEAVGLAMGAASSLHHALHAPVELPGLHRDRPDPGAPPGIDEIADIHVAPQPGTVNITCIDYSAARVEVTDVTDLDAFLAAPRPDWATVRWINVDGLHPYTINRFREKFGFHTLAAEDVLHVPQRPRMEPYPNHLFLTTRMLRMEETGLCVEQVAIFFYGSTVLSFQEDHQGDVWGPLRKRLQTPGSKVRECDGGFLLYSMLDAIIDHLFPIIEHYGDLLEEMEEYVVERPGPVIVRKLHAVRRQMVLLRRVIWPTRLMLNDLQTSEFEALTPTTKTYLRDVHEHALQLIDVVETYRDMASGMIELYLSAVSFRMNEIMKVLTIIATLFIPITFLAGVYGMNFKHMPELEVWWAYPLFWAICIATVASLLGWFYHRGWIFNRK